MIGVYADMPEDEYRAAPGLSASGIKDMLVSPLTYWDRNINPDHEDKESPALLEGRAYHKRILEGQSAFEESYYVDLCLDDYPDALNTMDQMKDYLRAHDLKLTGRKDDLIDRILDHDPQAKIWDAMQTGWRDQNDGKQSISQDLMDRLTIAGKINEAHPQIGFEDGYPEV